MPERPVALESTVSRAGATNEKPHPIRSQGRLEAGWPFRGFVRARSLKVASFQPLPALIVATISAETKIVSKALLGIGGGQLGD